MARARNIKPSFFDNDELASNDPLGRLLFIGLWTLADYKGDLEWRGKRIQKQILPYDDCCIDTLAINLDKSGFIRFYSDGDKIYLNIVNFAKHQNPHKNERAKGSDIPKFSEEMRQAIDLNTLAINLDKSGLGRNNSDSNPADSLLLIPDSLILKDDARKTEKPVSQSLDYSSWPAIPNEQLMKDWKAMRTRIKANVTQTVINKTGKELHKAVKIGFTVDQCFETWIYKGWRGFEAEWMRGTAKQSASMHDLSGMNYESGDL